MTWFKDWLKTSADRLAANLREAGWPSSSDPVVTPEGMMPEPRRFSTTGLDLARPNADETILTPSVADPVGSMLGVVPARRNPPVQSNLANLSNTDRDWALDHIITECKHPGIQIVRFPNGETSRHCTLCAKTWGSLAEAVDDAEQTQPINITEMGEGGIPAAVEQMASDMSYRLGQTMAQLVAATNPGTAMAMHQYEDFASMTSLITGEHYDSSIAAHLRANTPFVNASARQPLQVREGDQTQDINIPEQDPTVSVRLQAAQNKLSIQQARESTTRRQKAMEEAARAAAAAFDAGIEAENNPVKLDSDRKLKAI